MVMLRVEKLIVMDLIDVSLISFIILGLKSLKDQSTPNKKVLRNFL